MAALRDASGRFIKGSSGATSGSSVAVEVTFGGKGAARVRVTGLQKAMERADKRLARYMGKPLQTRARRAYLEGAKLLVTPMRREISRVGLVDRGTFRGSVRARTPRLRPGELAASSFGPTDPKRHLLIRGHRIVTRGGRDTGRRTEGVPVVDIIHDRHGAEALRFIASRVVRLTGSTSVMSGATFTSL